MPGQYIRVSSPNLGASRLSLASGSLASPSLSFASDPDTGLYNPADGQLALVGNGNLMFSSNWNSSFSSGYNVIPFGSGLAVGTSYTELTDGTISDDSTFHIVGTPTFPGSMSIDNFSVASASSSTSTIGLRNSRGTAAAKTALTTNDVCGRIDFGGYRTSANLSASVANIRVLAAEAWSNTATGSTMEFRTATIGGTSTALALSIANDGSITANRSDILVNTAGKGLRVKEGSNAKQGTATLVAGTVVVSNTSVTANSRILLTSQSDGGVPGFLRISARTAATSFTILSSSNLDTSVVAYQIFEPA